MVVMVVVVVVVVVEDCLNFSDHKTNLRFTIASKMKCVCMHVCVFVVENFTFVRKSSNDEDCHRGKMVDEVIDDGRKPGDGLGGCGFDSSLYL